jgi:cytosine deaminase
MELDLVIRRANVVGLEKIKDIAIEDGRIVKICDEVEEFGEEEVDARGRLTSPGFVDAHMHLDKALLGQETPNVSGTLREAIEIMGRKKREFKVETVKERAVRVVKMAVGNGTTTLRTNVDVDPIVGLTGLEALLHVKEECSDLADIQIVAFPQEGMTNIEGAEELLREAMKRRADVVGGIPALDPDPQQHIDKIFSIARDFGVDISMHIDESDDPRDLTLEYYAEKAIEEEYPRNMTAGHCCSLAAVDDGVASRVIRKVCEAGINVVALPSTNLYLQGRGDNYPIRRGITRVRELLNAGVNVLYASDNIRDPFNPFGNANMLELALILAHGAHMGGMDDLETIFRMGTVNAARAVGIKEDYGIEEGKKADIVVLDAQSPQEAIISRSKALYVIKNGDLIVEDGKLTR